MPTAQGGTPTCHEPNEHQRRLAAQLADLIPGAATARIALTDPAQRWPSACCRVWNAAGEPIALSRTMSTVAARWVLRTWPEADWTRPHTLDLASVTLTPGSSRPARSR